MGKNWFEKLPWISKISAFFVILTLLMAICADWVAPFSYEDQNIKKTLSLPDGENIMGTDRLGRDIYSRILYGARVSLFIGLATTAVAIFIGTIYGGISGYVGGRIDSFMMRLVDVVFALPDLLLIILITVLIGRGITGIFLALTMVSWVLVARLVRGEVLLIKQLSYIEAARALGSGHLRILLLEILPNLLGILLVTFTFRIPLAILSESTLSFIGLGIAPPESSWGTMANEGWSAIKFYPHLILFPSLAIFLTILSFNFFGEGLRDILDPRHKTQPLLKKSKV